jgi:hypothetical protein
MTTNAWDRRLHRSQRKEDGERSDVRLTLAAAPCRGRRQAQHPSYPRDALRSHSERCERDGGERDEEGRARRQEHERRGDAQ